MIHRDRAVQASMVLVLATFLSAGGCKSGNDSAAKSKPVKIEDVAWQLSEIGGRKVAPVPADGKAAYLLLSSSDQRVTGYGGVNQFNGTYQLNGESLRFGPLAMTRRAGPEPLMRQEDAFARALMTVASWRAAGDNIVLLDAGGNQVARFTRP